MKKLIVALVLLLSAKAQAFQILSAVTKACHENITLASMGEGETGFIGDATPVATSMLNRFIARVNETGIPDDKATRALLKEMTKRFGWEDMDPTKRYILMSLVAGARSPDTQGFSVIDINHIRGNHLTNAAQSTHLLRRRENDGPDGNVSAIQQTRDQITAELQNVVAAWAVPGAVDRGERWTFPFYGEHIVQVFGPAYSLGAIAHSIEDSYSHTIRDENMKIVAVANYLEQILDQREEDRDGPAHSERMDQCNPDDAFDAMRIHEARKQVATLFNAIDAQLAANGTDLTAANAGLDTTFDYVAGCARSNEYCGTPWFEKATSDPSEPYRLGYNCGVVKSSRGDDSSGPLIALVAALFLLPIALITWLRVIRPLATKQN